jgi:hypothetical protein
LLVRKGNPFGINGLGDVARTGARLAQADSVEAGARAGNRAAIEGLIGKPAADAFFANEVEHFPGRLGITHRDVPEMLARGYADVGLTQYHLISYWARTFPNLFQLVPIAGAERFPVKIAFGRVIDPLRPRRRGVRGIFLQPGQGRLSPLRFCAHDRRRVRGGSDARLTGGTLAA